MRINNPKSFAGFALKETDNDRSYKLATVGQVQYAIKQIDEKFEMLLRGAPGSESARLESQENGIGGLVNKQGYAWLNMDGKVDPSLLPALAITETHVIPQNELPVPASATDDTIYTLLNTWVQDHEATIPFQKGDILIVTPQQSKSSNTTALSTVFDSSNVSGMMAAQKATNPAYSGTYIITDVVKDSATSKNNYTFAKIAYTDSNIVTVNDCAPGNSAGQLTLYLRDILKTGRYLPLSEYASEDSMEAAKELEDVVYRLGKIKVDGDTTWRFAFMDDTAINSNPTWIPYAKLEELNQETADRLSGDEYLNNLIARYRTELDAADQFLSAGIDDINENLGTRNDTATVPTDGMRSTLSSTVYDQLAALRYDVDYNAEILHKTKLNTNDMLTQIQANVNSLYTHLDGKAVAVLEKQFVWTSGAAIDTIQDFEAIPVSGVGVVQGATVWTYDYVSPVAGSTTASPNALQGIATSYENIDESAVLSSLQSTSQERILAVFDPNGEKVDVDIKSYKDELGTYHQVLTIQTDWFGDGNAHNSIFSNPWTMLISKTIIGILNAQTDPIKVGDVNEMHYLSRGVQDMA